MSIQDVTRPERSDAVDLQHEHRVTVGQWRSPGQAQPPSRQRTVRETAAPTSRDHPSFWGRPTHCSVPAESRQDTNSTHHTESLKSIYSCVHDSFVPVKFVPVKFVPVKFVPVKFVPVKFVPVKFVPVKFVPVKSVPKKLALRCSVLPIVIEPNGRHPRAPFQDSRYGILNPNAPIFVDIGLPCSWP
jgi:hypothetical protein